MIKEVNISFPGGMDSDSDDANIARGDYRMLKNMRNGISSDGKGGTIENFPNVSQITMSAISGATFLGAAEDHENDVVYLLYSNNYLVSLDKDRSLVYILKGESALNLNESYPIYNARYLDGKVYFTDNNSEPKVVDIQRAINYTENFEGRTFRGQYITTMYFIGDVVTFGNYYYTPKQDGLIGTLPYSTAHWEQLSKISESYAPDLQEQDLYIITKPPMNPPEYYFITDSSYRGNRTRNKNFQFAYRYVYQDFRKSVFSPASQLVVEGNYENIYGTFPIDRGYGEVNNAIRVEFHTGSFEVQFIEIIYRSTDDMSTWYLFKTVEKRDFDGRVLLADDIEWFEIFHNDTLNIPVSDTEVYKPYHYVPEKAGFLELIDDNHLVFADVVEGKDPVTTDVSYELSVKDVSSSLNNKFNLIAGVVKRYTAESDGTIETEAQWYIKHPSFHVLYPGEGNIVVKQYYDGGIKTATISYSAADASIADTVSRLRNECIAQGMDVDTAFEVAWDEDRVCFNTQRSYTSVEDKYYDQGYSVIAYVSPVVNTENVAKVLKQGAIHSCGLVYMDDSRRASSIVGQDQMKAYVPFMTEDTEYGSLLPNHRFSLKFIINHKPPSWATKYMVVYQGSNISTFWCARSDVSIIYGSGFQGLRIFEWYDKMKEQWEDFSQEPYEFQEGDRARLLGIADFSADNFVPADEFIDVPVLGLKNREVMEDGELVEKEPYVMVTLPSGYSYSGDESVWEIYRPKKTDDMLFYETGQVWDISETGNGFVHEGNTDQVLDIDGNVTTSAVVNVDFGDAYKYMMPFFETATRVLTFMENPYSAIFGSKYKIEDLGFPKVFDEFLKNKRLNNRYRYGGSLQLGTKNNQIADFEYGDYGDLEGNYGIINGLEKVGFVLKLLQSHRVWSIYIKRTSSFNPDGSESLILTDAILGTKRPDSQIWGLQDRGAVAVHERHMYFWDRSRGLILRDSANGLFPISDYKMINYFRDLSFDAAADMQCRIGFNEAYDEVYFCFYEEGGSDNKIVVFLEDQQRPRWTHEIEIECSGIANIGNRLFTFLGNIIDSWFNDTSYSGFLRAEYPDPEFEFVVNVDPEKVKRWRALSYDASHKFYAPNVGDISTPANDNYGSGMETRLLEASVKSKEGVYYASIKNDANTPGAADVAEAIVNGRPLRGKTIKIKLTLDASDHNNEYINFENVKIVYSDSEKS